MTNEEIKSMFENVSAKEMQNVISYITKEQATKAALEGKNNEEMIKFYLDFMREQKPELAAKYPTNAAGKTVKDCMEYIINQAKKLKNGNGAMVISTTVFEWAEDYFIKDEIKKATTNTTDKETTSKSYNPGKKRTLEDLQKDKTTWEENNKKQIDEWEQQNNSNIDKWEKEHAQDLFKPENPYCNKQNPYLDLQYPNQEELDKLLKEKENKNTQPQDIKNVQDSPENPEEDIEEQSEEDEVEDEENNESEESETEENESEENESEENDSEENNEPLYF